MGQSTITSSSYLNSNLFSGYYLDERVDGLNAWDCEEEAVVAFEELRDLWRLESDLVASYKEDELLDSWIDEVLSVLGFGTLSESTLPDGGGYNDRLLFESREKRRDAARKRRDGDRETATKTNSLVDRLKKLTLPAVADVEDGLASYRKTEAHATELEAKIERTDDLIDQIVYELYGLTDEEIEIVEESVGK